MIEEAWLRYRSVALLKNASGRQVEEARRAFLAGAGVMWTMIHTIAEETRNEIEGADHLQELKREWENACERGISSNS
jgi:hypothetical protein